MGQKPSSSSRLRGIAVVVTAAAVVIVVVAVALWLSTRETPRDWEDPGCGTPSDDDCFQEMLQGSPSWDDPRLLQVVKEEFLRPPEASSPTQPHRHPLSPEDAEILKVVKEKVGEVKFVVGVTGVSLGLVEGLVGMGAAVPSGLTKGVGATGLWVDPKPEDQPGRPPLPHLWYSHACLTSSVPYMNKLGHQCLSLASLLHAAGRPQVDLVLGHALHPARLLTALCAEYDRPVKAVLVKTSGPLAPLLDQYRDRVESYGAIGNNTIVYLRN